MANQPILDNSNDPFGSFSGSVERTATSPEQVDAVLARARMRDHQALQKQLGMGAPTPQLGAQLFPQQTDNDPGNMDMDLTGERRFPTPPTKPVPPSQGYDPFDRKEVFRATPGLNLPNDPKNFTETYIDPIQPTLDSIGNALGSAGETIIDVLPEYGKSQEMISGAIDDAGKFIGNNLPEYGASQEAISNLLSQIQDLFSPQQQQQKYDSPSVQDFMEMLKVLSRPDVPNNELGEGNPVTDTPYYAFPRKDQIPAIPSLKE